MFKEYGELSTILYQHTKPVGRSVGGDIEYYFAKLKQHGVSGLILEAGVGTGRMLIPLIQSGFRVDGVDLSPEMLAQCKTNLEKHDITAELYQQDLTKLSLPGKYGAIIMPTGSFCLLPRSITSDVLAAFYEHLEDGGIAIIDIELPVDFESNKVDVSSYALSDSEGILFTSISQDIDWVEQKTSYIHRYELICDGVVRQTEVSNFTLFWYGVAEFEMKLKAAGFADVRFEVGYGGEGSRSLVSFVAVK